MESSNSSASNLSLKNKVNISPVQNVINTGSNKNLQKCNSGPMSSFIHNSSKGQNTQTISVSQLVITQGQQQPQFYPPNHVQHLASNQQNYARDSSYTDENYLAAIASSNFDPSRFVYKSNSQKSINWEGTPQNQTHKSINNKNTGSQSHQSLFGSQGKKSIIQNSSKKMLMPSGSSGTLLRKEIGKLNFTGKPFAPDSIFINNLGKSLEDLDDLASDLENADQETKKENMKIKDQMANQITNKNYNTVSNNQQTSQAAQMKKSMKQSTGNSKKNLNNRNISPQEQKLKIQSNNLQIKDNFHKLTLNSQQSSNNQSSGGRLSMGISQNHIHLAQEAVKPTNKKYSIKIKPTSTTSAKYSPSHQPNGPVQELNSLQMMHQKNENRAVLSQTQKVRISFIEQSSQITNLNNISSQKTEEQNPQTSINKLSQQNYKNHVQANLVASIKVNAKSQKQYIQINPKSSRPFSNQHIELDQIKHQKLPVQSQISSLQYSSNQFLTASQSQFNSKSPAEKMFESSLLSQGAQINNNNGNLAIKHQKLMTQEFYGYQNQILTPNRGSVLQVISRKNTGGSYSKGNNVKIQSQVSKYNQQINQDKKRNSAKSGKVSAKNSSNDLSNLSNTDDNRSPDLNGKAQIQKKRNYGNLKLKGDSNNFNEISESILEENIDKFTDDTREEPLKRYHQKSQIQQPQSSMMTLDSSRLSPNKSNKVPSSLAFKRSSNDQPTQENSPGQMISHRQPNQETSIEKRRFNFIEEDLYQQASKRELESAEKPLFTLKDKPELKRNIPKFSQFYQNSIQKPRMKKELTKSAFDQIGKHILIEMLDFMIIFCDFDLLMKIMSTQKQFRQDMTKQATQEQEKYFKIFHNQLRIILIQGLPSTLQRIHYWNYKTKFYYGKKKKPNLYRSLKNQKCDENEAAEIKKDVHRTFPDMKYFQYPQKGQKKLFNILNAVAKKNAQTGYIQGMNFLAGTILINLQKGEESFWMMMSILNVYKFDSILDLKSGGLFQVLCYQLEVFLQHYIPDLAEHFKRLGIPTDIFAANWFITMFCYELSMDLVFCILDVFLLEGIKSLIRVSLALLRCLKERLLVMNYDECMVFLSHCQKDIELDSQTLMENAFSFKITKTLLYDLELFYRLKNRKFGSIKSQIFKAFSRLSLQEEEVIILQQKKIKSYWIILPATPDDIKEILRRKDCAFNEEDIAIFYQQNIKHRKLKDIVEELQTDEDSEIANVNNYALEKKDIQNAQIMQPSQRKKETLHSKYAHSGLAQQRKKPSQLNHFSNTDSNNTIIELTNDYSKGGLSGGKANNNNSSYAASNLSMGDKLILKKSDQKTLHVSLLKGSEDNIVLITPRKIEKFSNELSAQNLKSKKSQQSHKKYDKGESESPFIQIGSKIKSIFGNFFKTADKLNKSYEELQGEIRIGSLQSQNAIYFVPPFDEKEQIMKQARSKSIHNSAQKKNQIESPDIRVTTYMSNPIAHHKEKVQVTTTVEDNHNIPNSQLYFKTPTQKQFIPRIGNVVASQDFHKPPYLESLTIRKQPSKSLDRSSDIDSSVIYDEEEECDIDLLSQSADYTIQTVGDNIQSKRHQEFTGASKRPEILIARDLVAGDEEVHDSQNYSNMDIQMFEVNQNSPMMNRASLQQQQMNRTIKIEGSQNIVNVRKMQGFTYNSYSIKKDSKDQGQKTMKSSPPVSPKEKTGSSFKALSKNNAQLTKKK